MSKKQSLKQSGLDFAKIIHSIRIKDDLTVAHLSAATNTPQTRKRMSRTQQLIVQGTDPSRLRFSVGNVENKTWPKVIRGQKRTVLSEKKTDVR